MKHVIFAIYDEKAGAYLPPFMFHAIPMAIRSFTDCITDQDHAFGAHPEDYTLYCLGEFDDSNATYDIIPPGKEVVLTGLEARAVAAQPPIQTLPPQPELVEA